MIDTTTGLSPTVEELETWLVQIKEFMEKGIPFNKFLGIRSVHLERGTAHLLLPFRDELVGNPMVPALHGGTMSALADTAGGAAVFSAINPGDACSTIDLRIDYLRPAALVDTVAEAELVRLGGRVGVSRIRVWQPRAGVNESGGAVGPADESGRLQIAEATGVYAIKRRR
jgi:uncharacterized protein (TIGR00369 family)